MARPEQFYNVKVCLSCKFYFSRSCHRYPPPTAYSKHQIQENGEFPQISLFDWCGEHVFALPSEIDTRWSTEYD